MLKDSARKSDSCCLLLCRSGARPDIDIRATTRAGGRGKKRKAKDQPRTNDPAGAAREKKRQRREWLNVPSVVMGEQEARCGVVKVKI